MKNEELNKTFAIVSLIGGVILGLCGVHGWGWLIFLAILIL